MEFVVAIDVIRFVVIIIAAAIIQNIIINIVVMCIFLIESTQMIVMQTIFE